MNKMSLFIIIIIVAALIMTSFGFIFADAANKYSGVSFNNSELEGFEKIETMQNISTSIQNRVENQSTDPGITDVVGGFYADVKDTLLLSSVSFDVFREMSSAGMGYLGSPGFFKTAILTIVLIFVFVGIILSAVVGRSL